MVTVGWCCQELPRVRPTLRHYCGRLASPDQFGAAQPKPVPAAECPFARSAIGLTVPALHWMDAPAVADRKVADTERLCHRTLLAERKDGILDRQREAQLREPAAEGGDIFELGNFWILGHRHSLDGVEGRSRYSAYLTTFGQSVGGGFREVGIFALRRLQS